MTIQRIIRQLEIRARRAGKYAEEIRNYERQRQLAGINDETPRDLREDLIGSNLKSQAADEFGLSLFDPRTLVFQLDAEQSTLEDLVKTLRNPIHYVVAPEHDDEYVRQSTGAVKDELERDFDSGSHNIPEALEHVRNHKVYPVFDFEMKVKAAYTPGEIELQNDGSEDTNYVLKHDGQTIAEFTNKDGLFEQVRELVTEEDADINDYTVEEVEVEFKLLAYRGEGKLKLEIEE